MDYSYKIIDRTTNNIADEYRHLGNYTNTPKNAVIEKATAVLSKIGKEKYYAAIFSFDWKKGNRIVGTIGR